jgi:crotonobetainyl-CoA:carnitine CoA-transferase CaiB-like acyl-CoA transferase
MMGRSDLASDPRYETHEKRSALLDELEAHIQNWVLDQPSADSVVAALERHGLPGARIFRMSEALDCEQSGARRMTVEVDDRCGRRVRVLNSPYRFSHAEAGVAGPAAFRGEDNRTVLRELLGLDDTRIASLESEGVISARIPPSATAR